MEPNIASERSENAPRTERPVQSEMGKSLTAEESVTERKEETVIAPQESEAETQHQKKKSRSEYTPIRCRSQEPNRHHQHLIIQATGNNHSNTPTSTDLVNSIAVSNRSEQEVIRAIEVPIDSATTATRTADEENDETMAAEKRERSPSPETKKGTSGGKRTRKEQDRIAEQGREKRERASATKAARNTGERSEGERSGKSGEGETGGEGTQSAGAE